MHYERPCVTDMFVVARTVSYVHKEPKVFLRRCGASGWCTGWMTIVDCLCDQALIFIKAYEEVDC